LAFKYLSSRPRDKSKDEEMKDIKKARMMQAFFKKNL